MRRINNTKLCPVLSAKVMAQSREEVPIIVQMRQDDPNVKNSVTSLATQVTLDLPLIHGFAGYMSTDMIYRLTASNEIEYISFDSKVYTLLDIANASIEAYFPHDRGYEGEGITVAVIDTGVAPHNDLVKPVNRIIGFKDFVANKKESYDDNGHGTHVAGIIAGNGYSSRGKYSGVAPKSNILSIKALDENGGGNVSDIIAAIAYAIETKDIYNTKIINLSIGTPANSPCDKDPLCKAVGKAIESGLIVIAAAGNSGPEEGSILSPGINSEVITVGAVDDKRTIDTSDDTIATFSSRGPTSEGIIKPDIVAPGVNIKSLSNIKLDGYSSLSGTSMATPLVSGSVALLLSKYGNLTPQETKDLLLKSCIDLREIKEHQGQGMLNLKKLFIDENEQQIIKSNFKLPSKEDTIENILTVLIVLFLLDSRI